MTAEEIFSSWIFYVALLCAVFLLSLFIDFKKEINKKRLLF